MPETGTWPLVPGHAVTGTWPCGVHVCGESGQASLITTDVTISTVSPLGDSLATILPLSLWISGGRD